MTADTPLPPDAETCPVCGSPELRDIRCKIICLNCRSIVKSCADL
ncbi:MAG: hypothetical protein ABIZ91_09350 [Gemmatimonadaceae bacterium]